MRGNDVVFATICEKKNRYSISLINLFLNTIFLIVKHICIFS
ncbi:hypothetical protein FHS10_003069 [Mucilaginibacter dorajii]|nr:hypothetical protein [Mucilaginibacter dorajii]